MSDSFEEPLKGDSNHYDKGQAWIDARKTGIFIDECGFPNVVGEVEVPEIRKKLSGEICSHHKVFKSVGFSEHRCAFPNRWFFEGKPININECNKCSRWEKE